MKPSGYVLYSSYCGNEATSYPGVLPRTDHVRFLPDPFQVIIYCSSHDSALYNLDSDIAVNEPMIILALKVQIYVFMELWYRHTRLYGVTAQKIAI
jgi:hypothetical protein